MQKINKAWLIKVGETLPFGNNREMRTVKIANKLLDRGWSVDWWTSAYDHFQKAWLFNGDKEIHTEKGLRIHTLKGCGYKRNISLRRIIDHRILARKFKSYSRKQEIPEIIICANPPYDLAREAVLYAKEHTIPIIIDIRDQWPDIFLEFIPAGIRSLAKFILAHDFKMNEYVMREATCLTSMMGSLLEWGLTCAKRSRGDLDRVYPLGSEKINKDAHSEKIDSLSSRLNGKLVVVFIGTLGMRNNPSILIDVASHFKNDNIMFILGGDGILFDEIQGRSKDLPNVVLTGWLKDNDIDSLLTVSHIGIIPNTDNFAVLPNKFFTYLSAGIPIISSCSGEISRIIEENKIGMNYSPGDVDDLDKCIRYFYNRRDELESYAKRASAIFAEMYDSNIIYENFADQIEYVADRGINP